MSEEKTLLCPRCKDTLSRQKTPEGFIYACKSCGGRTANLAVLEHANLTPEFIKRLWKSTHNENIIRERICPHCSRPMIHTKSHLDSGDLLLDICTACQVVWFDDNEFAKLPRKPPTAPKKELSPKTKMVLLNAELETLREQYEWKYQEPDSLFKKILAFLGFPVETNYAPLLKIPYVTWLTALFCILVFFLSRDYGGDLFADYGFIANQWSRLNGLTFLTSFFLHGDIFHLIFNMYFLVIFGDNAENQLGRIRFLILLLFSHLTAVLVTLFLFPHHPIPAVGASAGIAGIMGYYCFKFPKARITFLWGSMGFGLHWIKVPVRIYLFIYVCFQVFAVFFQFRQYYDISYMAHLSGIFTGLAWAYLLPEPSDKEDSNSSSNTST